MLRFLFELVQEENHSSFKLFLKNGTRGWKRLANKKEPQSLREKMKIDLDSLEYSGCEKMPFSPFPQVSETSHHAPKSSLLKEWKKGNFFSLVEQSYRVGHVTISSDISAGAIKTWLHRPHYVFQTTAFSAGYSQYQARIESHYHPSEMTSRRTAI